MIHSFLADRTNGRAIGTLFRPSVRRRRLTLCIVAKRCVLEQKVTIESLYEVVYEKSIGTKMNDLDLCFRSYQGHVIRCVTFDVEYLGNR